MAMSSEIKERIFAAADSLHAASETGEYPSVEAVRQESRAGMNNVVEGMKEWRQNQRKQVQAVREPLPVELHSVVQDLGQSLWETAQQLANESLDAAKVSFEMEKTDLIQLSAEQSEAYEAQALELTKAEIRIADLDSELQTARADIEEARSIATEMRDSLRETQQAVHLAEQRAEEVERRAGELRAELDHAHIEADSAATAANAAADNLRADADRVRIERDKAQQRQELAEAESTKLAAKLAEANAKTAKAEAAADNHSQQFYRATEEIHKAGEKLEAARAEVAKAREEVATLRGQLEATTTQNANLMAALKPAPAVKPGKSPKTDN